MFTILILCGYMSEISQIGEVTAAADWWSVGALLYEIITGQVSFNSLVFFDISIAAERKGWLNCSSCSVLFPLFYKKKILILGEGGFAHSLGSNFFLTKLSFLR